MPGCAEEPLQRCTIRNGSAFTVYSLDALSHGRCSKEVLSESAHALVLQQLTADAGDITASSPANEHPSKLHAIKGLLPDVVPCGSCARHFVARGSGRDKPSPSNAATAASFSACAQSCCCHTDSQLNNLDTSACESQISTEPLMLLAGSPLPRGTGGNSPQLTVETHAAVATRHAASPAAMQEHAPTRLVEVVCSKRHQLSGPSGSLPPQQQLPRPLVHSISDGCRELIINGRACQKDAHSGQAVPACSFTCSDLQSLDPSAFFRPIRFAADKLSQSAANLTAVELMKSSNRPAGAALPGTATAEMLPLKADETRCDCGSASSRFTHHLRRPQPRSPREGHPLTPPDGATPPSTDSQKGPAAVLPQRPRWLVDELPAGASTPAVLPLWHSWSGGQLGGQLRSPGSGGGSHRVAGKEPQLQPAGNNVECLAVDEPADGQAETVDRSDKDSSSRLCFATYKPPPRTAVASRCDVSSSSHHRSLARSGSDNRFLSASTRSWQQPLECIGKASLPQSWSKPDISKLSMDAKLTDSVGTLDLLCEGIVTIGDTATAHNETGKSAHISAARVKTSWQTRSTEMLHPSASAKPFAVDCDALERSLQLENVDAEVFAQQPSDCRANLATGPIPLTADAVASASARFDSLFGLPDQLPVAAFTASYEPACMAAADEGIDTFDLFGAGPRPRRSVPRTNPHVFHKNGSAIDTDVVHRVLRKSWGRVLSDSCLMWPSTSRVSSGSSPGEGVAAATVGDQGNVGVAGSGCAVGQTIHHDVTPSNATQDAVSSQPRYCLFSSAARWESYSYLEEGGTYV